MIFCDTSTVAKLYVPERESHAVRQLLETAEEVCISALVRVELLAVFHRRLRERKWHRTDFTAALRQFSSDEIGAFWTWLPLDRTIIEAAAKIYPILPETVFLRSSDCLHLATALHHNFSEIYTHDAHQMKVAIALGLKPILAQ